MSSTTAHLLRDVDELNKAFKKILLRNISLYASHPFLQEVKEDNRLLREENESLQDQLHTHKLKTRKIVKEVISTDPETDEVITERETTTYIEDMAESDIGRKILSYWKTMNPMRKQAMWKRFLKGLIMAVLIGGALFAIWKGLKGTGIVHNKIAVPVEHFFERMYYRVPYLSRFVDYLRSWLPGVAHRTVEKGKLIPEMLKETLTSHGDRVVDVEAGEDIDIHIHSGPRREL